MSLILIPCTVFELKCSPWVKFASFLSMSSVSTLPMSRVDSHRRRRKTGSSIRSCYFFDESAFVVLQLFPQTEQTALFNQRHLPPSLWETLKNILPAVTSAFHLKEIFPFCYSIANSVGSRQSNVLHHNLVNEHREFQSLFEIYKHDSTKISVGLVCRRWLQSWGC